MSPVPPPLMMLGITYREVGVFQEGGRKGGGYNLQLEIAS